MSQSDNYIGAEKKKSHKMLWCIAILAVVIIALAVTNPDKQKHRDRIVSELNEAMDNSHDSGLLSTGISMYTGIITQNLVSPMLDTFLDYDNYIVCSKTSVTVFDKTTVTSFGILGHVFTFDNKKLTKELNQFIESNNVAATDSLSTQSQQGVNKIIDGLGDIVKEQVTETEDSTTSAAVDEIINAIKKLIK